MLEGELKVGQEIMIAPGKRTEEKGSSKWTPLKTKIIDLKTGGKSVKSLTPGGSAAMLTELDPSLIKSDKLAGNIVSTPDKMPPLHHELTFEATLLKRVVGAKKDLKVDPLKKGEPLMMTVFSTATVGMVTELKKKKATVKLKRPVCAHPGTKVAISRRIGARWRLIGYAFV